jgi:small subunit ribosomal protein S4
LNGRKVNIPSAQIKPGDVIAVAGSSKEQLRVKAAADMAAQRGIAEWLDVDFKKLEGTFKSMPERSELPSDINEHLVVELYSK